LGRGKPYPYDNENNQMIISPTAKPVTDIALAEYKVIPGGFKQPDTTQFVFTWINKVYLLCNACEYGICKIEYWIRGGRNNFDCIPPSPFCPKCPQWTCGMCGGGGGGFPIRCTPITEIDVKCIPVKDVDVGE
jgi:hypothetical protein